ncbi:MAG: T9SS type A sorting domain-containing protein, partial [Bacteroidetes bacterium]|nr:T9SS type A sorting domain-containing protein [Bacteroidota bacterium]
NVVPDDNGGAIVTWQDSSSGSWDIRAQHLLLVGTLDWNVAGKFVSAATNHQVSPKNCSDGNGGSIFAFQDFRNGSNYDIYAYKIQIKKSTASSFEYHAESMSVFPNPSNGKVNFQISSPSLCRLTLSNSLGQQVLTSAFQQHFSAGDLSSGIYFYNISDSYSNESIASGKIIVE